MRREQYGRSGRVFLTSILISLGGLSGCGGGSGSSQSRQAAPLLQQTAPITSAPSVTALSPASDGCSLTTFAPNFAAETDPATGLSNQLYHWTTFPTQVYFAPSAFLTPIRKAQALAGFDWWGLATGQAVRYTEVSTSTSANIVVQFEERGQTNYGAITEYHMDGRRQLVDATITFNMTYLVTTSDITPVAAHEFGHAMGIGGHSNDHGDVMSSSPEVYFKTALSSRDLNTLKTAYCGLPDALGSPGGGTAGSAKSTGTTLAVRCELGVK